MKKLLTPALDLMALGLIVMIHYAVPGYRFIQHPWHMAGVLVLLPGLFLMASSFFMFQKYKTPISHTRSSRLITSGVFSLSRNPVYLGKVFLMTGLAIITAHLFSLLVVVVYIILYHAWVIPMEERLLKQTFGTAYIKYRKKVRRWL